MNNPCLFAQSHGYMGSTVIIAEHWLDVQRIYNNRFNTKLTVEALKVLFTYVVPIGYPGILVEIDGE